MFYFEFLTVQTLLLFRFPEKWLTETVVVIGSGVSRRNLTKHDENYMKDGKQTKTIILLKYI